MIRKKTEFAEINNITFFIDSKNEKSIRNWSNEKNQEGKDKIQYIITRIVKNSATKDMYSKENYSNKIKNVCAIKFKSINNSRIYCKDYIDSNNKRVIILSELLKSKKQDELTQKERNIINRVNNYDYE